MMPRTTVAAAFATVSAAGLLMLTAGAAAQDDAPPAEETTPVLEGESETYFEEEEYSEEEDYSDEGSFCGGEEEPTLADLAYSELEAGNIERARRMLVEGLRSGGVERWQRPYALATLAEAQLRLREYGQAVVNYRKALRLEPDGSPATHVGLATALYLRGSMDAARAEAEIARDLVCSDQYSQVACFSAQAVLARTARTESDREAAEQAMRTIRESQPDYAEQLDEAERRISRRPRRARSRQS